LKFEKLGLPHKTLSCSCSWSTSCSCNINCGCNISCSISFSCSASSLMPVTTLVAVPAQAAVPVVVNVFCEVLWLIFIALMRLTLENIHLNLSYKLNKIWSFKGSLFIATTIRGCHYLPIMSELCTYICLNYTIISKGYLQEKGFCV